VDHEGGDDVSVLDKNIVISGTDPTNPKTAEDVVRSLEHVRAGLINMATEAEKVAIFAGSGIRTVLHYDQSMPDKRATMVAVEVSRTIKALAEELDEMAMRTQRAINDVTGCGVNLKGKFEWRKR
jgi:hypothetical protein